MRAKYDELEREEILEEARKLLAEFNAAEAKAVAIDKASVTLDGADLDAQLEKLRVAEAEADAIDKKLSLLLSQNGLDHSDLY